MGFRLTPLAGSDKPNNDLLLALLGLFMSSSAQ
jgi:hypothetical protein